MGRTNIEDIDIRELMSEADRRRVKMIIYLVLGSLVVIFLLIVLFGSFYTISAGERGVLLTFGKASPDAKTEGLHLKFPLVQKIIKMDVRTQKYEADLTAASADLQDATTKIAINYRLSEDMAPEVYKNIGLNYAEKVLFPLEQEANKATTAQYVATELVTKREEVRERMKALLIEKLTGRGIIIEDISIVDFKFGAAFTTAIENKVTAEQNALTEKNRLEQVKYEAQQKIEKARGEAESVKLNAEAQAQAIKLQAETIKAQGGSEYIELQRINKWNGVYPTTLFMSDSSAVPLFQISTQ